MRAPGASALLLSALCRAALAAGDADVPLPEPGPHRNLQPVVLELSLNGRPTGETFVMLRERTGTLWLRAEDFARVHLRIPREEVHFEGEARYYALTGIPGVALHLDPARSAVDVSVPAAAFEGSSVSLSRTATTPRPAGPPGVFLNYVAYGQRGSYGGSDVSSLYTETGLFAGPGTITSTALATAQGGTQRFTRLESTASHDFFDSISTLRLGDSITVPGAWAQAVRFAGIQFGSNYAMRPDLVTTPLLAAAGTAVVPSSVDVFVNGRQVGSTDVPAGPFVVSEVPALTGSGDVRVVLHDALGQVQVITLPFYSSAQLLQPGLTLYDADLGAVRNNFGIASDDYGPWLASFTWRHGFSTGITGEIHAESLGGGARAVGIDVARQIGTLGVATLDLAAGGAPGGCGGYESLGFQRQTAGVSVAVRLERASTAFRDVGYVDSSLPPIRHREFAEVSFALSGSMHVALAGADQLDASETRERTVALSFSALAGPGSVSANWTRTFGSGAGTSLYLIYTLPLGPESSTSTTLRYDSTQPGPNAALVQTLQKSVPAGSGGGYLASVATDGSYQLDLTYQGSAGTVDAGAARQGELSAQRVSASGALIYFGGEFAAARTVRDSFALVDLQGLSGITVYFDNQPVSRTDGLGFAIVRDLRSYDVNRLSIDPLQLPLEVSLDTDRVQVVPPFRSGALVHFPVRREHRAVFHLRQVGGQPVPAGASLRYQGQDFPVGLEGFAYVTGHEQRTTGRAHWEGHECRFVLPAPPRAAVQPDLGEIVCSTAP
ncbi:MAG: fimbrial biogenesis outer membrane usher protein [Proteobacteria bacterium]|nr:fimbrial biogenesis outer membrane usher protein [Pseudomonadota bacterium]